ncbi:hypothetical protein [uncultured Pseudodesulfovibrio sp.]|uniref:hypothetical protein n=1 Tax=uncultured Pseudodesulfovibrio sp. TaxID=2035858 RepID=UPI0029C9807C|nr:hypothetical protein [uncultured Pseudodesulfovibrio sp.]
MTAQFPIIFDYGGEDYALGELSNGAIFSPTDWGVETQSDCSALWRGYNYGCSIIEDSLYLTFVYMNAKDGLYPKIGGITPEEGVYRGLEIRVPYNGQIRLLKDFDRQYYVHQGFQSAAAHHTVLDFTLNDGLVTEIVDKSDDALRHRKLFNKGFGNSDTDAFGYERIWRMLDMDPLQSNSDLNQNESASDEVTDTHIPQKQIIRWFLNMWNDRFPEEMKQIGHVECSKQAYVLAGVVRQQMNSLIKYYDYEEKEAWEKTQKDYLIGPAGPECEDYIEEEEIEDGDFDFIDDLIDYE